ncbi:MAG: hypothetical protein WBN89_05475 [Prochlorococcaceae cyanobacterium]
MAGELVKQILMQAIEKHVASVREQMFRRKDTHHPIILVMANIDDRNFTVHKRLAAFAHPDIMTIDDDAQKRTSGGRPDTRSHVLSAMATSSRTASGKAAPRIIMIRLGQGERGNPEAGAPPLAHPQIKADGPGLQTAAQA